jgi:DNA-directed RNA polymerase specialized sigma24 family protein
MEKRKFDEEWALLRKQYQAAGMCDETIRRIREIDIKEFNSRRRYTTHTLPILSLYFQQDAKELNEERNLSKCSALAISDVYFELSHSDWIEYIENELLYKKLKQLSKKQIKLLTYFLEGYSQEQIADLFNVSQAAIAQRIRVLKNFLKT